MSVKDKYSVKSIDSFQCKDWCLNKHYAKRLPPIEYSFGVFNSNILCGIVTFSTPASRFQFQKEVLELNRLVINEGIEKNVLSFFVSKSLLLIPEQRIIVSYADPNQNHHGYIYQATNWVYTGISSSEKNIFIDGKKLHRRTLYDMYGTSSIPKIIKMGHTVEFIEQLGKHRYFTATGNKKDRVNLISEILLKYNKLPYPKGDNKRYDASYTPNIQTQLF